MKQLKNFLIKREQSQARLSFAKREKSRLLAKTLLTLVALLAVTTGAWADETPLLTIESKDYADFRSGSMSFDDKVTITFSDEVENDGDTDGWYRSGAGSLLTVAGTNGYTITSCKFYTDDGIAKTGYTIEGESPSVYLSKGSVYTDDSETVNLGISGITKIEVFGGVAPASSGPEVAWDKAKNSGTFTMPGGNVTLEPEYYPQAALTAAPTAINDVPATTDGAIVSAGTVANIGETTTAQGTVMYYVSPTALDDAALLALAADQWTADVPTAADLAQGPAYVYYYVRGNDSETDEENFSDGDILAANALTVTLAAEPTYAVTFADDLAEPTLWSADPAANVKKGTEVTVTYTGSKKVLGVKAEKKAAAPASTPLDNTIKAWTAGTYAVPAGGLTYSDAITVSGDVTLVLTDGETLTLNSGLSLASGATLTVEGNGTMNVNGTNNSNASTVAGSTGTLVLTSGTLTATGGNGQSLSTSEDGQTGASGGVAINGNVTINGGTVTATGGNGGNLNVTLGGGVDHTHAGNGGAAISGNATVNGGTWTATNGTNGSYTGYTMGLDCSAGTGGKAVAGTVTDNRN